MFYVRVEKNFWGKKSKNYLQCSGKVFYYENFIYRIEKNFCTKKSKKYLQPYGKVLQTVFVIWQDRKKFFPQKIEKLFTIVWKSFERVCDCVNEPFVGKPLLFLYGTRNLRESRKEFYTIRKNYSRNNDNKNIL